MDKVNENERKKKFLDILDGMKLHMDDGKGGVEEIGIPIEYFAEHEIIEEAIKNCVFKYNKYRDRMNKYKLEKTQLKSFKILKSEQGNSCIEFEFEAIGNKEPFKITITPDKTNNFSLKISVKMFLKEIDRVLKNRELEADEELNKRLQSHEISRSEWVRLKTELMSSFPATAEEYMEGKAEELKRYHEHITDRPEYQDIFRDDKLVVDMAKDTFDERTPRDRHHGVKVNEQLDFEHNIDPFLRQFTTKKCISISSRENPEEEVYRGYIFDEAENDGVIIVLEPTDCAKTTFVTFERNENIQILEELLSESDKNMNAYEYIIAGVMGKTWREKVADPKIVCKYHGKESTYKKNLEYLITGNRNLDITHFVRNERRELLER